MSKFTGIIAVELDATDIDIALSKAVEMGEWIVKNLEVPTKFLGARVHLDGEEDDEPLLHVLDKV